MKHRRICPGAEANRDKRTEQQHRTATQSALCIGQVSPEILEQIETPEIEDLLFDKGRIAKLNRIGMRAGHFLVKPEFGFKIPL